MRGNHHSRQKKKESNSFSSVAVALRNKFHHRVSCFMHRASNFGVAIYFCNGRGGIP